MPRPQFVSITPEILAVTLLTDCAAELDAARANPLRVLFAAKALHSAFVAALTAALAGSAGLGAYDPKLRALWLEFLESNREPVTIVTLPNKVMSPRQLLDRASEIGAIEWSSEPLDCSPEDRILIDRLTLIRGHLEHPKPALHSFEVAWILETFPIALRLTLGALQAVAHHLPEEEMINLRDLGQRIIAEAGAWGMPVCADDEPSDS